MNDKRYDSLLYSLDHAIELFSRIPTTTAAGAAAFESLKQTRVMLTEALAQENAHRAAILQAARLAPREMERVAPREMERVASSPLD